MAFSALGLGAAVQAQAQTPPDWLSVHGEHRSRYETLNHQFRFRTPNATPPVQGYSDTDDVLMLRTLLRLSAQGKEWSATLEGLDARAYGFEADSFVDTSMVDTADVLQAFVGRKLGALGNGTHELRVGRQAIDLGSRRLMARNAHRNTINAFTGVDWLWRSEDQEVRAFWMLPVDRRPKDAEALRDNDWQEDDQDLDVQFAGLFYGGKAASGTRLEAYLLWLDESGAGTRNRELWTPGLRWSRPRQKDSMFFEVEAAVQFGESKTSASAATVSDHLAGFAHASVGYAFDAAWSPAVQLAYDHATGDQDPDDDDNNRFDSLFGARRWEYGPTGIYGAIARANLRSPEARLMLKPSDAVRLTLAWRGVWLAEDKDAWTASGLRDRSGQSGSHVGDQFEFRVQWQLAPKSLEIDAGVVYLAEGSFQDRASQGQGEDTSHAYVQATWTF